MHKVCVATFGCFVFDINPKILITLSMLPHIINSTIGLLSHRTTTNHHIFYDSAVELESIHPPRCYQVAELAGGWYIHVVERDGDDNGDRKG